MTPLNDAFAKYKENPSADNYDTLGKELLKYTHLFTKSNFRSRCTSTEIEDISSVALIEILKSLPTFNIKGKATLSTWVGTIILHCGKDHIIGRAKRNECNLSPNIEQHVSSTNSLLLQGLIDKLDAYDKLFTQLKLRGYTNAEVAERLAIPIGTVDWQWKDIQAKLRTLGGGIIAPEPPVCVAGVS